MARFFSLLLAGFLVLSSVPAAAQKFLLDEEQSEWWGDYRAEPLADAAPEEGWSLRAAMIDDWGKSRGLISLHIPRDRGDGAWIEFLLPRSEDRRQIPLEAWPDYEPRFRLLGELVTLLAAEDYDNRQEENAPLCIHAWGAVTQFVVDGEVVREFPADACNRNEKLFDFAMEVAEIAFAEMPECATAGDERDPAIIRLWACAEDRN